MVGVAIFAASFTQVIAGFGFGLLSVPLMTLAIAPRQAVIVSTLVGVGVTTWQAIHLRADVDRAIAKHLVISAYIGMPVGLAIYSWVPERALQISLGVMVMIFVVVLGLRIDVSKPGRSLEYGAGFVSGVLNTSLSTNGPPLVFALQARQLSAARFRATISAVFAFSNVFAITLFIASGKINRDGVITAAIAFPAMAVGQVLGFPVRKHVDGERFRWLVLALLTVAGASVIIKAFA